MEAGGALGFQPRYGRNGAWGCVALVDGIGVGLGLILSVFCMNSGLGISCCATADAKDEM